MEADQLCHGHDELVFDISLDWIQLHDELKSRRSDTTSQQIRALRTIVGLGIDAAFLPHDGSLRQREQVLKIYDM